jgi:cytochrome P450
VSVSRRVKQPFTFSNGVTVQPGELISCHLYGVHQDKKFYPNAQEFDGWRFLGMNPGYTGGDAHVVATSALLKGLAKDDDEDMGGKETKRTMYTTSKMFLTFGHGKHAWLVTSFLLSACYNRSFYLLVRIALEGSLLLSS